MVSVPVKNTSGDTVGEFELDLDAIAPEINKQLLHDVVVMYEANQRVGTVRTKARGEVVGSTAKLYRQKGTGRARAGARRTPVRRGGGHTFAKRPRNWGYRLPKKAVRLATRMALRSKFEDGEAVIVDDLGLSAPKTAELNRTLKALELDQVSCLLATDGYDRNVWLSGRNIPTLHVSPASNLNAYDLLHQHRLIVLRSALEKLTRPANED